MDDDKRQNTLPPDHAAADSTDRSLLRRFQARQDDAATELYLRYARRLQTLARPQTGAHRAGQFDPDDIVQSVFRTLFWRASGGCYAAPVGEELRKLLLVIALNRIRALGVHHRAQWRDATRTITAAEAPEAVGASGADARAELIGAVEVLLGRAPERVIGRCADRLVLTDDPHVERARRLMMERGSDHPALARRHGTTRRLSVRRSTAAGRPQLQRLQHVGIACAPRLGMRSEKTSQLV